MPRLKADVSALPKSDAEANCGFGHVTSAGCGQSAQLPANREEHVLVFDYLTLHGRCLGHREAPIAMNAALYPAATTIEPATKLDTDAPIPVAAATAPKLTLTP
ncbi:hypothetical protein H7J74_24380 [Mycobacterium angelicum]|nr:hypothetical protein [Mycobacterium angelicum]